MTTRQRSHLHRVTLAEHPRLRDGYLRHQVTRVGIRERRDALASFHLKLSKHGTCSIVFRWRKREWGKVDTGCGREGVNTGQIDSLFRIQTPLRPSTCADKRKLIARLSLSPRRNNRGILHREINIKGTRSGWEMTMFAEHALEVPGVRQL